MSFAAVLLLTFLLAQGSAQSPPSSAIVPAGGHTYQIFCAQQGELIRASDTGICQKTEAGGVERFEIRNEDGDVQFDRDAPADNPFNFVGMFSFSGGQRKILDVETSHGEVHGNASSSGRVIYYFEPTAAGLVPFTPSLTDVDGFAQLGTGIALSRTFNAGFFQFSVLLGFDPAKHRIAILPDQPAFSAFPPPGRQKAGPSPASGEIQLYANHDSSATKTDVRILPGHAVTWWQSPDLGEKPVASQNVMILAAWAPATLKPADNAPQGVQMVYFDWNNLWLQIEADDHTGWIRGANSFRRIGLEMAGAQH
jgi:hypothetical protein